MPTVSYGLKISNENHIFDQTIEVYLAAVNYLMDVVTLHYDRLAAAKPTVSATVQQVRQGIVEHLVHSTRENTAAYPAFDKRFYKFPSYLRRDAITTAIGKIFAYRAWVSNWEADGRKGKRPFLNRNQDVMPCFYRKNTFLQDGTRISIKLYNGSDWVWHEVRIRPSDFRYVLEQMIDWKESAPVLVKRNRRYELRFAYTAAQSRFPKFQKGKDVDTVLGVDLGINTDAVCSVVHADGTVTGQKFLNCPVEIINNYNEAISVQTAAGIVNFANEHHVQVIVMEYLHMSGKKRGSKKQRLTMWRKRDIQRRVEAMASRYGIRVSYVCAVNTSRLAYDGSGKVFRGGDGGFITYELCRFQNGKVYNCDLSASKNIGARYFIRVLLKSTPARELLSIQAKVPELGKRTSCVLATLINFHAMRSTFKTGKPAA